MSTNHPEIKTDVYEIINNKICAIMVKFRGKCAGQKAKSIWP